MAKSVGLTQGFALSVQRTMLAVAGPILLRRQVLYPLSYEGGVVRR
jgi:hypothetical protein